MDRLFPYYQRLMFVAEMGLPSNRNLGKIYSIAHLTTLELQREEFLGLHEGLTGDVLRQARLDWVASRLARDAAFYHIGQRNREGRIDGLAESILAKAQAAARARTLETSLAEGTLFSPNLLNPTQLREPPHRIWRM